MNFYFDIFSCFLKNFLVLLMLFSSCITDPNLYDDDFQLLDFPSISTFGDSIIYYQCNDEFVNTPKPLNFEIYEDTIIDLNQFDKRLDIKLRFNWNYEDYFDIGVNSIDILLNKKIISTVNIGEVISLEAFPQKSNKNGRFGDPVRDDIYMRDINFDSYLDFKVRSVCGQGCWYSYWIFNKKNNKFERNEDLDSFRPYYFDCKNQIIYSYLGGSAWYHSINAYKVINHEIKFFQSIYKEYRKEYSLKVYRDHNDSIIKADTTYEK